MGKAKVKKPKPATAGEKKPDDAMRLALKFAMFPDGRIVYGPIWCEKLAKAIRSMNARAVRKERERCSLWITKYETTNMTVGELAGMITYGTKACQKIRDNTEREPER